MKLGKYKHYKGKIYEVIGVGLDADSHEKVVVYRGLYDSVEFGNNPIWVKNISGFLENVEWESEVVPRFKYLEE
jgi:hypothetical protein